MAKDTYDSFQQLAARETWNRDYRLFIRDRKSTVTIAAPHGGRIEPGTSDVARFIAKHDYNCYCFEGMKAMNNRGLHITSHCFDEPEALSLLSRSTLVVTIHACKDQFPVVHAGGLDRPLRDAIAGRLRQTGVVVSTTHPRYRGVNPLNVCNRGATGQGVQLEISRAVRDDAQKTFQVASAVRAALAVYRTALSTGQR